MSSAQEALFRFLRDAPELRSLQELNSLFAEAAASLDFSAFAYVHYAAPGVPMRPRTLFGRRAGDWAERYAREQLARHDPTLRLVFAHGTAFTWSDVRHIDLDQRQRRVFEEARRAGLTDGFVVPVAGAYGEIAAVVLTGDRRDELNPADRASLSAAAIVYATCGRALFETLDDTPADVQLTQRECQCLAWTARGKTDWEIGMILGISPRTVGQHIDNARAKLDVPNRTQAVVEAWRRGLLIDLETAEKYEKSLIQ